MKPPVGGIEEAEVFVLSLLLEGVMRDRAVTVVAFVPVPVELPAISTRDGART